MSVRTGRRPLGRRGGIVACMMILWLGITLAGCDGPPLGGFTRLVPTPTPTAIPTVGLQPTILPAPSILPAFSGWRAAYLNSDGHLHAISLSDHSDLMGMEAPGLVSDAGASIPSVGAAPDGRAIAYVTSGTLTMLDLARQRVVSYRVSAGARLAWSPDSAHLALDELPEGVRVLDRASAKLTDITPHDLARPIIQGWRDADHLVLETTDLNYTQVTFWLEDVRTQTAHQLLQMPITSENASFTITIAPNGAACVLYTWQFQSNSFTPLVETIDLTTGAIHPLPNITKTTGANFDNLIAAWRPDGAQVALRRQGLPSEPRPVWILDLARDTATHATDGPPPVGWAPDGSALILSTSEISEFGDPPHELAMLPLPPQSPATPTRLTDHAGIFPFLGFVRGD